jgi:tRNA-dihydrouridine synthase
MKKLPSWLTTYCGEYPEKTHIYGININMGCPDPQIISAGQGAALIKRRKRIVDLVNAFLESHDHSFHLSLKFRLGMNRNDVTMRVLLDVFKNLSVIDDERFHFPIIHFKHAKQQSDDVPIWEYLNPLLDADSPFILNGNIAQPEDILSIRNQLDGNRKDMFEKQMKGVMIGRALITNPDLFLEFQEKFRNKS